MNEPVVPGGNNPRRTGSVQRLPASTSCSSSRSIADRPRPEIARSGLRRWSPRFASTIKRHLITVGLVDWSLDRPGLTSGFVPQQVAEPLDFVAVHIYPEKGKLDEALETLKGFGIGKPVVIEETFPLKCNFDEMTRFLAESRGLASGWISFYWGRTADESRRSTPHIDRRRDPGPVARGVPAADGVGAVR